MSNKYFGGLVIGDPKVSEPVDDELIALALETPKKVEKQDGRAAVSADAMQRDL